MKEFVYIFTYTFKESYNILRICLILCHSKYLAVKYCLFDSNLLARIVTIR
jgi:hypothetical protein